jgi:hypothetical protein
VCAVFSWEATVAGKRQCMVCIAVHWHCLIVR